MKSENETQKHLSGAKRIQSLLIEALEMVVCMCATSVFVQWVVCIRLEDGECFYWNKDKLFLLRDFLYLQGDKEAELGLPFSPLCDRKSTMVAQSQIGEWFM